MYVPNIINLRTVDVQEWIEDPNNEYIGRSSSTWNLDRSQWANPYKVNRLTSRSSAIRAYERYIQHTEKLAKSVGDLKGKILGCWCTPQQCHGEVLHRLAGNSPLYQLRETVNMSTTTSPAATYNTTSNSDLFPASVSVATPTSNLLQNYSESVLTSPSPQSSNTQRMTDSFRQLSITNVSSPSSTASNPGSPSLIASVSSASSLSSTTLLSPALKSPINSVGSCSPTSKVSPIPVPRPKSQGNTPTSASISTSNSSLRSPSPQPTVFDPIWKVNRLSKSLPSSANDHSILNETQPEYELDHHALTKTLLFLVDKIDKFSVKFCNIQNQLTNIQESLNDRIDTKICSLEDRLQASIDEMEAKFDEHRTIFEEIKEETGVVKEETLAIVRNDIEAVRHENADLKEQWTQHMNMLREHNEATNINEDINTEREAHPANPDDDSTNSSVASTPDRRRSSEDSLSSNDIVEPVTVTTPIENSIAKLQEEVKTLRNKLFSVDCRVVECEQYSRRDCLIITGIPANIKHLELQTTVINVLAEMGMTICYDDISACHRLPGNNSRLPAKVIVKFVNRKIVDFCLKHTDVLQQACNKLNMNLRFHQSLCATNEEALRICKWLHEQREIHHYFIWNGFVKVVVDEGDNPVKVNHPAVLCLDFPGIPLELSNNR